MNVILKDILDCFEKINNTLIGPVGSLITIYDHFANQNTHIDETYAAIHDQSKKAYDLYCEYRKHKEYDLGIPSEERIVDYWKSCLQRDTLPSVNDLVEQNIASKEEAKIILPYLMSAWMEVPDFVGWLHEVLIQSKFDELSQTLKDLQRNYDSISLFAQKLEQQNIHYAAIPILQDRIKEAKYSCTDSNIKNYYMVDNNYNTMFTVISAEEDIPHKDAAQTTMEFIQSGSPIIISGNGGLGKTSLMMHAAVHWAAAGNIVVWMSLSNSDIITQQKATAFFDSLTKTVPDGQQALLCIDNPFEGKESFLNLQKMWPDNGKIQLIMAERTNRLALLADPAHDSLFHWFDDAKVIMLLGTKLSKMTYSLKDYKVHFSLDTQGRRKEILNKCTLFLVKNNAITETARKNLVETTLRRLISQKLVWSN